MFVTFLIVYSLVPKVDNFSTQEGEVRMFMRSCQHIEVFARRSSPPVSKECEVDAFFIFNLYHTGCILVFLTLCTMPVGELGESFPTPPWTQELFDQQGCLGL